MANGAQGGKVIYEPQINDPVNHPSHYTDGKIEVIEYIEDKQFNFNLGQVIKYVSRAGKKLLNTSGTQNVQLASDKTKDDAKIQDLEKAKWYLEREINNLKGIPPF